MRAGSVFLLMLILPSALWFSIHGISPAPEAPAPIARHVGHRPRPQSAPRVASVPVARPRTAGLAPETPSAAPTPPPLPKGAFTPAPLEQLTREAWDAIEIAARTKPTPEEAEHFPRALFPVTAALGRIAVALRRDPSQASQGIAFYRDCAQTDNGLTSVRAVCARNLRFWQEKTGDKAEPLALPDEVARVVKMLPPLPQ